MTNSFFSEKNVLNWEFPVLHYNHIFHNEDSSFFMQCVFHWFRQAEFVSGGWILSSSQFLLLPQLPKKMKFAIQEVKIDSKIIFLLPWCEKTSLSTKWLWVWTRFLRKKNHYIFFFNSRLYILYSFWGIWERVILKSKKLWLDFQVIKYRERFHLSHCQVIIRSRLTFFHQGMKSIFCICTAFLKCTFSS